MLILTDRQNYEDIADALRYRLRVSEDFLPSEMADAIRSIRTARGAIVTETSCTYMGDSERTLVTAHIGPMTPTFTTTATREAQ